MYQTFPENVWLRFTPECGDEYAEENVRYAQICQRKERGIEVAENKSNERCDEKPDVAADSVISRHQNAEAEFREVTEAVLHDGDTSLKLYFVKYVINNDIRNK